MADTVTETLIFDTSSFDKGASEVIRKYDEMDAKARELAKSNPFKGQADDLLKFNSQLRSGSDLFGKMASGPKATKAEVSRLSEELVRLMTNQDKAGKSGNWKQTEADIKRSRDRITEINKQLNETPEKAGKVAGGFDKLGSAIKTAFTVTGILAVIGYVVDFGKKLIDITGVGEKYQNQFTRIFGGNAEAAKGYLSVLQTTADTTNFTFDTLADNTSKLASRGIIPTKNELLGLGDVANFIGKDFGQLNESILDANNPDRWKELGFVVKTEGNKMKLSYGDFTTTVDNSVKGAYNAIQAFSKLGKVQGSTVEAGNTLSGQVSTLEDNFAGLFRTIGQDNSGVLKSVIGFISDLVKGATNLYKTLSPAFAGVTKVIGSVYSAVSGLIGSFGHLTDKGANVATTGQKIGFYFNKFVIDPFVLTINIAAQVIESFNTIVIAGQLAAAKLSGNKGLAATLTAELKESGQRLKTLRSDFVATVTDMRGNLDDFTRRDNKRARQDEIQARLNEKELANFNQDKPSGDKDTADPKAIKKAAEERQKLLEERKKFSDDLKALQEKYDKERLDTLDKNSQQYIDLKRKYDLEELEAERQKNLLIGQTLFGHKVTNARTGATTTVLNKDYKLPKETEDLYERRKQNIVDASSRDSGLLAEEQYEKERLDRTKTYRDAEDQFDKEQGKKRELLTRQLNENELSLNDALYNETEKLRRKAGESEIGFEQRKAEELLKIRLAFYEAALKLAEADPTLDKSAVTNLKKTIQDLKGELKGLQTQDKDGPKTLFQLLGLQYLDKDGNDITDKVEKQINAATSAVIEGANQILNQQISSDQAKIDSYDKQIEAKQNEIDAEVELQKQGLANNVQLKRQEQAALQEERQKALDQQRAAQAIQLELNAAIQASNLIVAVSEIIKTSAALPLIGQIAAGIQIAAMFALFYSTVSQLGSLPQYHDGDEVTLQTAQNRSVRGNRKPDEVDARLQVGEGVTRRKSYQANKALLQKINTLERPARYEDIGAYFANQLDYMDPVVKERDMQIINQYAEFKAQPDRELHRRIDNLGQKLDAMLDEARKKDKSSRVVLPDGRIRQTDSDGNVTVYNRT